MILLGKRSLYRSDTMKEDRKQLVGLVTDDPNIVLEEGAQMFQNLISLLSICLGTLHQVITVLI